MYRIFFFALTIFGAFFQTFYANGQPIPQHEKEVSILTVRGTAEISTLPDVAHVQLGAVARSEKAMDAQNQVSRMVDAILKAIMAKGIPKEKISTAELTLVPIYDHTKRVQSDQNIPRIDGYQATNMVRVEMEEMDKIGDVVDAAFGAGANRLERLSFSLKDDTLFRNKALREAVLNARGKAMQIADTLNLRIVRVLEISEEGVRTVRPQFRIQRMATAAADSTPIEPGQIRISATVIIGYQIENSGSTAGPSSQ